MDIDRLPVDAVASAVFGGLLGALFVVLQEPAIGTAGSVLAGSVLFGGLGTLRWIRRLTEHPDTR